MRPSALSTIEERLLSAVSALSAPEVPMRLPEMRCVFVTISPLLSAIIADVVSRRGRFQLLAHFDERAGLAARLMQLSPDLVVMGLLPGERPEIGASLLDHLPRAKILLVSGGADFAYLYELRPHRAVLFDFSPDNLAAAIVGSSRQEMEYRWREI
jgi:DNA-binding NarL/FixJ family response regulator